MSNIDFTKVESLRRHMLLTKDDMASVLSVSRMTYYSWLEGKPLRKANEQRVRGTLKKLLTVMTTHGWPMPEVCAMEQKDRKKRLVELLQELDQQ
jgi:DNA-binding XRE family transcriptional regulator